MSVNKGFGDSIKLWTVVVNSRNIFNYTYLFPHTKQLMAVIFLFNVELK